MDKDEKLRIAEKAQRTFEDERQEVTQTLKRLQERATERQAALKSIMSQLSELKKQAKSDSAEIDRLRHSHAAYEFFENQEVICEIVTDSGDTGYDKYAAMLRFYRENSQMLGNVEAQIDERADAIHKAAYAVREAVDGEEWLMRGVKSRLNELRGSESGTGRRSELATLFM